MEGWRTRPIEEAPLFASLARCSSARKPEAVRRIAASLHGRATRGESSFWLGRKGLRIWRRRVGRRLALAPLRPDSDGRNSGQGTPPGAWPLFTCLLERKELVGLLPALDGREIFKDKQQHRQAKIPGREFAVAKVRIPESL